MGWFAGPVPDHDQATVLEQLGSDSLHLLARAACGRDNHGRSELASARIHCVGGANGPSHIELPFLAWVPNINPKGLADIVSDLAADYRLPAD